MTGNGAPFIGVLMLDTAFERIPGDAGNPRSYGFAVRIKRVRGAGALDVVKEGGPSASLLNGFILAARALESEGAVGIISTCGFLVHFQDVLAKAVNVPVSVSALSLYPLAKTFSGTRQPCILTASSDSLRNGALRAAGINADLVSIVGMEGCPAFTQQIFAEKSAKLSKLNRVAIQDYITERAVQLINDRPETGCFLLECGNLPPYAAAVRHATKRPVLSILDAAELMWRAAGNS